MRRINHQSIARQLEKHRPRIARYLTILTALSFVLLGLERIELTKGLFERFSGLIKILTFTSIGLDILAFIEFQMITLSSIEKRTIEISNTVVTEPVLPFTNGNAAYGYLKETLEKRRNDIAEIHSTAIQQRGELLNDYRGYFVFLYEQFYSRSALTNPPLKNIVSFNPLSDIQSQSEFLFRICFAPLFSKNGINPITKKGNIRFWFVPADLFVPFVNFTLIKFKDESYESVWGWYVGQSDRLGEDDAYLNQLLREEIFARSKSKTMYLGFKSVFDLVLYNWEKSLSGVVSPMIEVGYSSSHEEEILRDLGKIIEKSCAVAIQMREGHRK